MRVPSAWVGCPTVYKNKLFISVGQSAIDYNHRTPAHSRLQKLCAHDTQYLGIHGTWVGQVYDTPNCVQISRKIN